MRKKPTTRKEEMCVWTGFHCYKIYTPPHPNDTGYRIFQPIQLSNPYYVMCRFCEVIEKVQLGQEGEQVI